MRPAELRRSALATGSHNGTIVAHIGRRWTTFRGRRGLVMPAGSRPSSLPGDPSEASKYRAMPSASRRPQGRGR